MFCPSPTPFRLSYDPREQASGRASVFTMCIEIMHILVSLCTIVIALCTLLYGFDGHTFFFVSFHFAVVYVIAIVVGVDFAIAVACFVCFTYLVHIEWCIYFCFSHDIE